MVRADVRVASDTYGKEEARESAKLTLTTHGNQSSSTSQASIPAEAGTPKELINSQEAPPHHLLKVPAPLNSIVPRTKPPAYELLENKPYPNHSRRHLTYMIYVIYLLITV